MMSPRAIFALSCRCLNSLYSSSSLNSGSSLLAPAAESVSTSLIFSRRLPKVTGSQLSAMNPAPMATKYLAFSGKMTSSGLSSSVSMNLCLSWDMYVRGPPRKATWPFILCPQARPLIVWFTTAWKIDAARFSMGAPSLIRGCMSVFANTPHLAAMG